MDTIKGKIVSLQEQLERFHNVGDSEWLQQAALSSLQAIEHTTKIAWDYQHRLENIMRIRDITQSLLRIEHGVELGSVLQKVAEAAYALLHADSTVIIPTTSDAQEFLLSDVSVVGPDASRFHSSGKPRSGGITEFLIQSPDRMVNVEDTTDRERYPFLDDDPQSFIYRTGVKAFVALRLGDSDDMLGLLFVNREEPRPFDQNELQLVELLGNFASIAVSNTRKYSGAEAALRRRRKEDEALDEIQRAVVALEPGLDTFLQMLLNTAARLTGVDENGFGFVQLRDEARNVLVIHASFGLSEEYKTITFAIGDDYEKPQGLTGLVAHTGESLLITDVNKNDQYFDLFRRETRSELVVPLVEDSHVTGIVNLESPQIGAFDQDHQRLLEAIGAHAVVAIRNMRLYAQIEEVSQLIQTINSTLDLEEVLNRLYDSVSSLTGARDMAISRYDEDENALRLGEFPMRASEKAKRILEVPLGKGVSGRAAKERRVVYVPDVLQHDATEDEYIPWIDDSRANLAVPLLVGEDLLGVLNIESPIPHIFDRVPLELLRILASSAAIAISNARRHQQLVNNQAYAILASVLSAQFHDIVQNDIGGLRAVLQRMEEKYISRLEHPPLQNLVNDMYMLADDALERSFVLRDQFVAEMHATCTLEGELNRVMASYSLPTSVKLVTTFDKEIASLPVRGSLFTILGNLIRNAVAAMDANGTLAIRADKRRDWLVVSVADTGRGIPGEDLIKIFEPGYTTKRGKGLGLGLWTTKTIIESAGGTIHVQSKPGETVFTFRLPAVK